MEVFQGRFLPWHDWFFRLEKSLGVDELGVAVQCAKAWGCLWPPITRVTVPITCGNHSLGSQPWGAL